MPKNKTEKVEQKNYQEKLKMIKIKHIWVILKDKIRLN